MSSYTIKQQRNAAFNYFDWCRYIKYLANNNINQVFITGSNPVLESIHPDDMDEFRKEYNKLKN